MPYNFYGYSVGDILNSWANMGVFAYVLPFLMIFALVYGILAKTQILGTNKGVHATLALAFGLLALQFDYVTSFYAIIFPYAGMGVAVLLLFLIFTGLIATQDSKVVNWIWFGAGVVIFVFVLFGALTNSYWFGGFGFRESAPALLTIVLILGLISLIIWGGGGGGARGGGH